MRSFGIAIALMGLVSAASAGELRIRVNGLASSEGSLRVAFFTSQAAFKAEEQVAAAFLPANEAGVELTVALPPGTYGISTFHDRNGNRELDRNLVGLPTEPYGFSNGARGSFGPPSFEQMSFAVGAEPVALEIGLR